MTLWPNLFCPKLEIGLDVYSITKITNLTDLVGTG